MKDAYWYYEEIDKMEDKIKNCQDDESLEKLEKRLDQLHDELYSMDDK